MVDWLAYDQTYYYLGAKNLGRPLEFAATGAFLAGETIGTLIAEAMTELHAKVDSLWSLSDKKKQSNTLYF